MGVGFTQLILILGPGLGIGTETIVFFQRLDVVSGPEVIQGLKDFVRGAHGGVILDPDFICMFADLDSYAPGIGVGGIFGDNKFGGGGRSSGR